MVFLDDDYDDRYYGSFDENDIDRYDEDYRDDYDDFGEDYDEDFDDEFDEDFDDEFEENSDFKKFNNPLKGKICDNCGEESIYYDAVNELYECGACGKTWKNLVELDSSDEDLESSEKKKKEIIKYQKALFEHGITRSNLSELFSPSQTFFKNHEIYSSDELASDLRYSYMLSKAATEKKSYLELKKIKAPDGIDSEQKEKYFYTFMKDYMSSVDELSYKASIESWAKYLQIDVDEVKNFFPEGDLNLEYYINPKWVLDNFEIIFSRKISELDEEAFVMNDEKVDMNYCFSAYLLENDKSYDYILNNFLKDELQIASRYLEAYKNKKLEFLEKAKENKLSVLETVMQFVDYAFDYKL